jgi:hypothetical protein
MSRRAATRFGRTPFGLQKPLVVQPHEQWVKRARLYTSELAELITIAPSVRNGAECRQNRMRLR